MSKTYLENLLADNERIVFSARQHWFIVARAIALEVLLLLVIFITAVALVIIQINWEMVFIVPIIGFLLMLGPVTTLTIDILRWSHHQYIITNWRVVQVSGIFDKRVIDSSLEKVNDVKMVQSALGRTFGYGDIEIMTASEIGANLFRHIEDPVHFKTAMLNAKSVLERGGAMPVSLPPAPDIPAMIARLDELRKNGVLTEEEFQQKKKELLARL